MEPVHEATLICPTCGADLPIGATQCPRCAPAADDPAPATAVASDAWLDSPLFLLLMLFGAALFLGFPWLWKSRAFSRPMKVVITILVLIETVIVFAAFGAVMLWVVRTIRESL